MKKVLALTAGIVVALVPSGTAFAGEVPAGNAYGNCKHSSAVSNEHTALRLDVGSGLGNGGLVELGKAGTCGTTVEAAPGTGTSPGHGKPTKDPEADPVDGVPPGTGVME